MGDCIAALLLWCLCICTVVAVTPQVQGVDLTLEEGERGTAVVLAVISKIEASAVFPSDNRLLRRIAHVASKDGTDPNVRLSAGGIWRVSRDHFITTQTAIAEEQVLAIDSGIIWRDVNYNDLQIPLYSGLAARLYLSTISESIPAASDIQGQAVFWNSYFNGESTEGVETFANTVKILELEEDCAVNTDLIFLIDSSGSINSNDPTNYMKVLQFVYKFVEPLDIGPDENRVGLIIFSRDVQIVFNLSTYWNKEELLQAINGTEYLNSATNTAGGLRTLINVGFTEEAGARLDSQTVLRIAVVLTDGHSNVNPNDTIPAANAVHTFKPAILVYVVGVTDNVNEDELEAIATKKSFIDHLTEFDPAQLQQSQEERTYQICFRASTPIDPGIKFNGMLKKDQETRLQFPIPVDGITVRLCVKNGHIVLYVSTHVPNPGEAYYDQKLECILCDNCELFIGADLAVIEGGGPRSTGRSRRQAMENETMPEVSLTNTTLYILVEGLEDNNTFSLESDIGDTTVIIPPVPTLDILLGCIIPGTVLIILLTVAVVLLVVCCCAGKKSKIEPTPVGTCTPHAHNDVHVIDLLWF